MTGKLIKTKISYQNLNRISVKGDKIDTLVGIDTAFHFEKNEKTGEVFLRPTEENGHNAISVSVTTMSGKTQDLLLEVTDGDANSIELIAENSGVENSFEQFLMNESFSDLGENSAGNDYEENIAGVMKKFINLSPKQEKIDVKVDDRPHTYVTAKFQEAYRIDGFICLKFQITTNQEKISCILDERMFSRKGDVALSLSALHLDKSRDATWHSATLYVLRR